MSATVVVHVVDDDAAIRDSLRLLLESSGFAVRTHDSARSLLSGSQTAGCVLTDIRMPDIDGIALLRRLREAAVNHLPVIVMTGEGDVAIAVEAMKAGAVD